VLKTFFLDKSLRYEQKDQDVWRKAAEEQQAAQATSQLKN